ncbi:UDP-4-amino-4,6-dideoxy-N-acetyl-beta-L-altrosamine transaminase [Celerinatantimonas sp. YJH-8]|uniref:UDP-4-amino-4, 6-dideoxy-N-acetyl-beta-L-altrosamine transaminase n=1 Tax=Celerinatantimonas sp. YJH-8 TaxID=3228714 RepID=UPI0038C685D5
MTHALYYGKQTIEQADIEAVTRVLRSDFLTQGPIVSQFENQLAETLNVAHVIACSNGTAALHLACLGLNITADDEVWVSAVSFVATANCARYCGARVRFIDIDPLTANVSIQALSDMLQQAQQQGSRLPKAVIVVHLGGSSCDMQAIHQLCHPRGIAIIEDACHALGGHYQQQPIGNCHYSDCCVFSFHPVKSITTAEGGAVSCQDPQFAQRIRLLASHGITKDPQHWCGDTAGISPGYSEQQLLGYNFRLSDLQAALGVAQLTRLEPWIERRHQIIHRYRQAFNSILDMQHILPDSYSAYHLAIILCQDQQQRDQLYQSLAQQHIFAQLHYMPIYRHPYYQQQSPEDFAAYPGAESYYQRALSLPIYPQLSDIEQQQVIDGTLSSIIACRRPKFATSNR